jgi:hypothetical protein
MKVVAHLLYCQNGGSGFVGLSYNSVLAMEYAEIIWWFERLVEFREAESKRN